MAGVIPVLSSDFPVSPPILKGEPCTLAAAETAGNIAAEKFPGPHRAGLGLPYSTEGRGTLTAPRVSLLQQALEWVLLV